MLNRLFLLATLLVFFLACSPVALAQAHEATVAPLSTASVSAVEDYLLWLSRFERRRHRSYNEICARHSDEYQKRFPDGEPEPWSSTKSAPRPYTLKYRNEIIDLERKHIAELQEHAAPAPCAKLKRVLLIALKNHHASLQKLRDLYASTWRQMRNHRKVSDANQRYRKINDDNGSEEMRLVNAQLEQLFAANFKPPFRRFAINAL